METKQHPYIPKLVEQLAAGRIGRRDFLRTVTLLGLSAGAAYGLAGKLTGSAMVRQARADLPKGGTLRLGMRVKEISNPHQFDWAEKSNIVRQVCEYLTITGQDNITRPYLLETWEVSDDLRTWTLNLRKDVKWHDGRPFVAEDVVWNLKRVLDPANGSSVMGLMKGYMLTEVQKDGAATVELWDANAIETPDEHTIRLNCKTPQLAVPEHLFHYPMLILDPAEDGTFGPGSNGTGPFELTLHEIGTRSVLKGRDGYWGKPAYLEQLEFIDLGDDPAAFVSAVASKQIDGLYAADITQYATLQTLDHLAAYSATTAETSVARGKVTEKPFDDPRVRKALRLATDAQKCLDFALQGLGTLGEHHHVCPVHPEYAKLPAFQRDVAEAKRLLAEAGYADGVDLEIACPADSEWQVNTVQLLVEQWREAGIRVKINVMPGAQFWDVWDKVPFGFTIWYHRPLGIMTLGLAYRSGVPWNESSYSNAEFDRLLTEAEGTLDLEARREIMAKLEAILQEDGPIVQPVWRSIFTFMDKRVKGFAMHPSSYIFGNELALEG